MSNIYKIDNYLAPNRAAEGDHYDMKIDAIIKAFDGQTKSSDAASAAITNTNTLTYFSKTVTIPANVIKPGSTIHIKALYTVVSPAANATTLALTLEAVTDPAPLTLYTVSAFNPADGTTTYMLEYKAIVLASGTSLLTVGDRWYNFTANTATIIPPVTPDVVFNPAAGITLQSSATWSVADANTVVLNSLSYNIL